MTYTRADFTRDLKAARVTREEFARQFRYQTGTVYSWGTARSPFPAFVPVILAAWIDNRRLRGADRMPGIDDQL